MAQSTVTAVASTQPPGDQLWFSLNVPKYAGYSDNKSVATFIAELRDYQATVGVSDEVALTRLLPVALIESAATWRRRQPDFLSMSDFVTRFRAEFLPPDYAMRMKDELRARKQHPKEPLIEFVRALQGCYDRADPTATDSKGVARAIHQSHPRFHAPLRGRNFKNLD